MAEQEFKEIKLSVPWGHVAARTYGSSTGKRVLMIHGRLDNAGVFTRLMKYLPKESFYYVCLDLPGHGWSSAFPSWMMIDFLDYVHALYFILEALQWKTFILLGHSMGGQIGLVFSVLYPNRIEKLIAIDAINMLPPSFRKNTATYLHDASISSVKSYYKEHNKEPSSFTKEEVLRNFMTMRMSPLNYEAADAIFERAITEVNGKYVYNRDNRLTNHPFTFSTLEQCEEVNKKLPMIPIYVIVPSHGIIASTKKYHELAFKIMKDKCMLEIIYVDGNHDIHNNEPEKLAPFICKILNSYSNSNKL
ncbi:serine hydrolase-like protein [Solenopsis invicta]|uniref:serine hydrolase-like protein n=1 Tax=Solenopsis invicta TaxID=13686 RepID=UPI000595FEB1|nr:serine hydrolase-like protein [Solenopsis invicta]XP_039302373.1 serine hydrolase-like protein [Solenopsis invicta]XP_039302374.1 serine hydrolase-like protein [Solenopsis invicta]